MSRARIVAAVTAVLGLVGLGLTMLPLISVSVSGRLLMSLGDDDYLTYLIFGGASSLTDYWEQGCERSGKYCENSGGAHVDVSGYDLIASGYAAGALIPIVLVLGVAAGALYAWRGRDRRVFTFLALASAAALFVLLFTWFNPGATISGTGSMGQFDDATTTEGNSEVTMSVGPGLYLPAIVLTVIFALTTWQAVASSNLSIRPRPRPQGFPMSAPPAPVGG